RPAHQRTGSRQGPPGDGRPCPPPRPAAGPRPARRSTAAPAPRTGAAPPAASPAPPPGPGPSPAPRPAGTPPARTSPAAAPRRRHPHHRPVTPLIGQELEHIRRGDLDRALRDNGEERLQVESHRPQRVRPAPARHELQIPVHQPIAQPVTDLARPRHETHKTREAAHFSTIPARDTRTLERHGSPVY